MDIRTYTYDKFTYTNKLFSITASDANLPAGVRPDVITIIGRTGAVVSYEYKETVSAGGDIVSWDYEPTVGSVEKVPDAKGTKVRIFND